MGFGPLAELRTKAAFPIAGSYRIIDFALSNLTHSDLRRVGVIIQYLPASLMDHIGSGRFWDFDVADRRLRFMTPFVGIRETRWFHGTGDAIAKNLNLLDLHGVQDVLILSGDHAYRMDYRQMIHHHRDTGADLTMACVNIPPERQNPRFGNVLTRPDGRVESFVEKPQQPMTPLVSMGIFCFKLDVLMQLLSSSSPSGDDYSLAGDIVQPNIGRLNAQAWLFEEPWYYLGDLEEYYNFHMQLASGQIQFFDRAWNIITSFSDRNLGSRTPAYFAPTCRVDGSIVSPGCRIEGSVYGSVLSPGVHVAPGAVVRDSILFHDVKVGEDCLVDHCVIDKDAVIERGACVGVLREQEGSPSPIHAITVIPKDYCVHRNERIIAGATPDAVALA